MNSPQQENAAVGRTVIFVMPGGEQFPAIIIRVHEDSVDLVVLSDRSEHAAQVAHLVPFDETGTRERTWLWPSFPSIAVPFADGERHVYRAGGRTTDAPTGQLDLSADPPSSGPAVQAPSSTTTTAGDDSQPHRLGQLRIPPDSTIKKWSLE